MTAAREIKQIFTAQAVMEGAGVHLKRAFGFAQIPLFDPFLLLDDFRSSTPAHYIKGFPWHPHRGIETITYVVDGDVEHQDSLGNRGDISAGDVQWMTAGRGIIHQEMPRGDAEGRMGGFQLWANLPASHKMMNPRYQDVLAKDIPTVTLPNGASIKIICGEVQNIKGPVHDIIIDPEYLDITLPSHVDFRHPTKSGHTVFTYLLSGRGCFAGARPSRSAKTVDLHQKPFHGNGTLLLFTDGSHLRVQTDDEPVRFLLVAGKPINEPVAWQGPIVMNTQEELKTAFRQYQQGTFTD